MGPCKREMAGWEVRGVMRDIGWWSKGQSGPAAEQGASRVTVSLAQASCEGDDAVIPIEIHGK